MRFSDTCIVILLRELNRRRVVRTFRSILAFTICRSFDLIVMTFFSLLN